MILEEFKNLTFLSKSGKIVIVEVLLNPFFVHLNPLKRQMNPFWEISEPIEGNFEPILRLYQNWLSFTQKNPPIAFCEGGFFNMAGKGICFIPDARFARYSVAALLTPAPQTKGLPKRFYEVKDFWERGKADRWLPFCGSKRQ